MAESDDESSYSSNSRRRAAKRKRGKAATSSTPAKSRSGRAKNGLGSPRKTNKRAAKPVVKPLPATVAPKEWPEVERVVDSSAELRKARAIAIYKNLQNTSAVKRGAPVIVERMDLSQILATSVDRRRIVKNPADHMLEVPNPAVNLPPHLQNEASYIEEVLRQVAAYNLNGVSQAYVKKGTPETVEARSRRFWKVAFSLLLAREAGPWPSPFHPGLICEFRKCAADVNCVLMTSEIRGFNNNTTRNGGIIGAAIMSEEEFTILVTKGVQPPDQGLLCKFCTRAFQHTAIAVVASSDLQIPADIEIRPIVEEVGAPHGFREDACIVPTPLYSLGITEPIVKFTPADLWGEMDPESKLYWIIEDEILHDPDNVPEWVLPQDLVELFPRGAAKLPLGRAARPL
jgi:hypothetical protein